MFTKLILLILLLLVAYGLAVVMLRRMSETLSQIGDLRNDMKRNDERLQLQIEMMKAKQLEQESKDEKTMLDGG